MEVKLESNTVLHAENIFCDMVKTARMRIVIRVTLLTSVLLFASFFAFWWFCGSFVWLYDSSRGYSPLFACPGNFLDHNFISTSGQTCRLNLVYNATLASEIAQAESLSSFPGTVTIEACSLSALSNPEYIYCYWDSVCDSICTIDGSTQRCPDPSTQVDPRTVFDPSILPQCTVYVGSLGRIRIPCYYVSVDSFCDTDFRITPGNELAIRGILTASFFIVVIWIIAELTLRSIEGGMRRENAKGRMLQESTLVAKKAQLTAILEERSCHHTDRDSGHSVHNCKSRAWSRRLQQYQALRNDRKSYFKSSEGIRSYCLYIFYFSIMVITQYLVLCLSPQHISLSDSPPLWQVLTGQISIWNIHSVLDLIVFTDIILDIGMFLVASACVQWPRAPVFSRHLNNQMNILLAKANDHDDEETCEEFDSLQLSGELSDETESLSFVLGQSPVYDCCLLIACHESTLTTEKAQTFANTLQCALNIFPPSHVFICDNGNAISPVDDTQLVARSVHPDINYLYVPEGNKTFAFYWCNRYWIPFLEKTGIVPKFTYAMIIDDDVPLPPDLHIPHEQLRQNPDIKAVHFPLTAISPETSGRNLLIKFQDLEYKLAAVHKQFQAQVSRCLSCHGAVSLWERQTMEEVFFAHDTVFHGEDMMMGLCLLKRRDNSRIVSAAQTLVPTYAPSSFGMLFRQRVKSWELTSHRKTLTYVAELINPLSFCHIPSLVLKPYFLQETITIILDWLRIYLLCGLVLRDWAAFLVMTSFFMALMYVQVLVFALLVLRLRKELRPTATTILAFPFYRLCGLLFRVCALCQNLLIYSHDRRAINIGKREDEIRDIPPVPLDHWVNWFEVWDIMHPRVIQQS